MASMTSMSARCLGLGSSLMRCNCCSNFGERPRLRVAAKTATAEDARRLMFDLRYKAPQSVMDFNKALWMRSMLQNTWWYRPLE